MRITGAVAAKWPLRALCLAMVTILGAGDAMAIEEAAYTVTASDGAFERLSRREIRFKHLK